MPDIALQGLINELLTLHGSGRFADMERRAKSQLQLFPHVPLLYELAGMAIGAQYRFGEALPFLEQAARGDPTDAQFWENLGLCQLQLQDFAAAETSLRRVLELQPRSINTLEALAAVLRALGRAHEAQWITEEIAAFDPDHAARAATEREQRLRQAIAADPSNAEFHDELGLLLRMQGDMAGAESCMRRAVELNPRYARARINLALLHSVQRRSGEALAETRASLEILGEIDASISPDKIELFNLAAFVLDQAGASGEAVAIYKSVYQFDKDPSRVLPMIRAAQNACDWTFAALLERDAGTTLGGFRVDRVGPGHLLNLASVTARDQLATAQSFARKVLEGLPTAAQGLGAPRARPVRKDRLRISYFSRDFYNHACGILMVGVIEAHDRSRFEIVAHDFTPPGDDANRRRLVAAFDRVIPIGQLGDRAAAAQVASDEIDVIVDINGWTTGHRAVVLAMRPAPVQVQWLGHAGTTGAPWIDYILADHVLIPSGHEPHFSEKIVRLPNTYQPTDDKRVIGEQPAKADESLPEDAFVFCCFNSVYKITPEVFDVWMKLLRVIDRSVLWLLQPPAAAVDALRREAQARGVAPERIVFAKHLPGDRHLGRLGHADLALDCFPYGSHTTASDALWAGVPFVALCGATFASRVSASILSAADLPEFITTSIEDYHGLALGLAQDRDALAQLRARVRNQRRTSALFDTARFTRALEQAFVAVWERHRAGLPPDHISLRSERPSDDALSVRPSSSAR